jgi:hypothetical protein
MDGEEQVTATEVIVEAVATTTVAEPDLVKSCVLVAVMVALPEPGAVAGAV